jgi:hypothetical protein
MFPYCNLTINKESSNNQMEAFIFISPGEQTEDFQLSIGELS